MNNEKPILFKPEMVRAILHGKKTQTRRVVKHIPLLGDPVRWCAAAQKQEPGWVSIVGDYRRFCPYGEVGGRLWVREMWSQPYADEGNGETFYRADGERDVTWKPSIHMPRWACRLVLEITDVRVERLNSMDEDEAYAEGIERPESVLMGGTLSVAKFKDLWDSIHKNDGFNWHTNPWVWVITFKRME